LYDYESRKERCRIAGVKPMLTTLSPVNFRGITADERNHVRVWDTTDGTYICTLSS
jgi:hypothetical protein